MSDPAVVTVYGGPVVLGSFTLFTQLNGGSLAPGTTLPQTTAPMPEGIANGDLDKDGNQDVSPPTLASPPTPPAN